MKEEKTKAALEIGRVAMEDLEHLDGCADTMIVLEWCCVGRCIHNTLYRLSEYWSPSNLLTGGRLSSTQQGADINLVVVPVIQSGSMISQVVS